jgi:hypothetical protein
MSPITSRALAESRARPKSASRSYRSHPPAIATFPAAGEQCNDTSLGALVRLARRPGAPEATRPERRARHLRDPFIVRTRIRAYI